MILTCKINGDIKDLDVLVLRITIKVTKEMVYM